MRCTIFRFIYALAICVCFVRGKTEKLVVLRNARNKEDLIVNTYTL